MKLGILGGTFNPVHNGHIYIAEQVINYMSLDLLYMVPSGSPPHKSQCLSYEVRCELLRKSIENSGKIRISYLDSPDFGTSYTLNLLKRFEEEKPSAEIFFIIGEDNVSELYRWYKIDEILKKYKFVVLTRNYKAEKEDQRNSITEKLNYVDIPPYDVSSSEIRNLLRNNKSIEHLVPKAVNDYYINKYEQKENKT